MVSRHDLQESLKAKLMNSPLDLPGLTLDLCILDNRKPLKHFSSKNHLALVNLNELINKFLNEKNLHNHNEI